MPRRREDFSNVPFALFGIRVGVYAMLFAMEPTLTTAPELKNILAELSSLEPIFHWPDSAMSRAELEKMTVEDFWETGASGRRYSRQFVLDVLEQRRDSPQADVWETSDFNCRRLAEDVCLLRSEEHTSELQS